MQGDNVLVTGGTGFLGDEVIRRLCGDTDAHLWVLARASKAGSPSDRILQRLDPRYRHRVTIVEGELDQPFLGLDRAADPLGAARFQRLLHCCDEIFHNAADLSFRSDHESRRRIMRTNVGGTARLLELAKRFRRPLKAFNFTSTAYVHGAWPASRVFREDDRPTGWRNAYEQSKWQAETLVVDSGLPFRIFRPSIIVTEPEATILSHDGMYLIGNTLAKGRDLYRRRYPHGHAWLEIMAHRESAQNFVLRRDVVDMFMKLRAAPGTLNRRFHAVTTANTRLKHMFDAMADILGLSYTFVNDVMTRNPMSHLFKRTVLPAYGEYLFNACPVLDQTNVRAALGNDYVDRTVTTIDAAWMKRLFADYFTRCGITSGRTLHGSVSRRNDQAVAARVEKWGDAIRVHLLGNCRAGHERAHLWRVRLSAN